MKVQGAIAMTVHVTDLNKARRFYDEGLGFPAVHEDKELGLVVFAVPNATPLAVHDWNVCKETGGRPPGTVSGIVFFSSDPKATTERAPKYGGTIVAPVGPGPFGVGGVIADPDGNEFIIAEAPQG